jgi:hypothetical protein
MFIFQTNTQTLGKQKNQPIDLSKFGGYSLNAKNKDGDIHIVELKETSSINTNVKQVNTKFADEVSPKKLTDIDRNLLGLNSSMYLKINNGTEEFYLNLEISGGKKTVLENDKLTYSDIYLTGTRVDRYGAPQVGSQPVNLVLVCKVGKTSSRANYAFEYGPVAGLVAETGFVATAVTIGLALPPTVMTAPLIGVLAGVAAISTIFFSQGETEGNTGFLDTIQTKGLGSSNELAPDSKFSLIGLQFGRGTEKVFFNSKSDFTNYLKKVKKAEETVFGKKYDPNLVRIKKLTLTHENEFGSETLPNATYEGVTLDKNGKPRVVFSLPYAPASHFRLVRASENGEYTISLNPKDISVKSTNK